MPVRTRARFRSALAVLVLTIAALLALPPAPPESLRHRVGLEQAHLHASGVTVVAHVNKGGTGANQTTTGINTTGATLLVAVVTSSYVSTNPYLSVTDSKSNIWVQMPAQVLNNSSISVQSVMFVSVPTSTGSGHTFTGQGNSFTGISVVAFSGQTFSAIGNGTIASSATSLQPGAVFIPAPATTTALYLASLGNNSGTPTINASFTIADQLVFTGGTNYSATIAYKESTAASENPTWSWTGSGAGIALLTALAELGSSGGGETSAVFAGGS